MVSIAFSFGGSFWYCTRRPCDSSTITTNPRSPLNYWVKLLRFGRVFPGTAAFQLYSSMGFPLDLLTLMAEEKVRYNHDQHKSTPAIWRAESAGHV